MCIYIFILLYTYTHFYIFLNTLMSTYRKAQPIVQQRAGTVFILIYVYMCTFIYVCIYISFVTYLFIPQHTHVHIQESTASRTIARRISFASAAVRSLTALTLVLGCVYVCACANEKECCVSMCVYMHTLYIYLYI